MPKIKSWKNFKLTKNLQATKFTLNICLKILVLVSKNTYNIIKFLSFLYFC